MLEKSARRGFGAMLVAVAVGPSPAVAQPVDTVSATTHVLTARQSGRRYRLRIAVPPGAGRVRLPLMIVLDGQSHFYTTVEAARGMALAGEAPPMVVVGIEPAAPTVAARVYDFTAPGVAADQPMQRPRSSNAQVGGLADFTRFLLAEALPFIESRAPVEPQCRALFGHSVAGLAVLHILLDRPASFESFAASSPSLWWGNRALLGRLSAAPRREPAPVRPRLLVTVGGREQQVTPAMRSTDPARAARIERYAMVDNAERLRRLMSSPQSPAQMSFTLFPDEAHASVVPGAISRAVRFAGMCPAARDLQPVEPDPESPSRGDTVERR